AAKPIAPDEKEREFEAGGRAYVVRRQGADKFDLQANGASAVKSPAALAREIARRDDALNAAAILADSNAPLAMARDPFFKRLPILGWIVIAAVIGGMLLYVAAGPSYQKIATLRVNRILGELHDSKGSSLAVKYWYNNNQPLELSELMAASDKFDRWRQQKNLYRQIGEFKVVDAEAVKGEAIPTAIVRFNVEGTEYRVKVAQDRPITWAE
ncbi:MAG TPA: hypothetical protein VII75_02150, partial [Thermoanaerobaculia bacterium]